MTTTIERGSTIILIGPEIDRLHLSELAKQTGCTVHVFDDHNINVIPPEPVDEADVVTETVHWTNEDNTMVADCERVTPVEFMRAVQEVAIRGGFGPINIGAMDDLYRTFRDTDRSMPYTVGDETIKRVFTPIGMTDLSNLQRFLDQVEVALLSEPNRQWWKTSTDDFSYPENAPSGVMKQLRDTAVILTGGSSLSETSINKMYRQLMLHIAPTLTVEPRKSFVVMHREAREAHEQAERLHGYFYELQGDPVKSEHDSLRAKFIDASVHAFALSESLGMNFESKAAEVRDDGARASLHRDLHNRHQQIVRHIDGQ